MEKKLPTEAAAALGNTRRQHQHHQPQPLPQPQPPQRGSAAAGKVLLRMTSLAKRGGVGGGCSSGGGGGGSGFARVSNAKASTAASSARRPAATAASERQRGSRDDDPEAAGLDDFGEVAAEDDWGDADCEDNIEQQLNLYSGGSGGGGGCGGCGGFGGFLGFPDASPVAAAAAATPGGCHAKLLDVSVSSLPPQPLDELALTRSGFYGTREEVEKLLAQAIQMSCGPRVTVGLPLPHQKQLGPLQSLPSRLPPMQPATAAPAPALASNIRSFADDLMKAWKCGGGGGGDGGGGGGRRSATKTARFADELVEIETDQEASLITERMLLPSDFSEDDEVEEKVPHHQQPQPHPQQPQPHPQQPQPHPQQPQPHPQQPQPHPQQPQPHPRQPQPHPQQPQPHHPQSCRQDQAAAAPTPTPRPRHQEADRHRKGAAEAAVTETPAPPVPRTRRLFTIPEASSAGGGGGGGGGGGLSAGDPGWQLLLPMSAMSYARRCDISGSLTVARRPMMETGMFITAAPTAASAVAGAGRRLLASAASLPGARLK